MNYQIIIDEVITKHKKEVDKLYPSFSFEDGHKREQYHANKSEIIASEIKQKMIDNSNIDVEDLTVRQSVINSINRFRDYCINTRPAR